MITKELGITVIGRDQASGVLKGIGGTLGNLAKVGIGAAVAGFGALAGGIASTIGPAADFQSQVALMGIASKETGAALDILDDAAIKVGGDSRLVGVDAAMAAEAMTNLYKAGLDTGEMFGDLQGYMAGTAELGGALRASIDLAAASELDMAQASDIVAVAMATFGLNAEDAMDIANNLVQTADASVASVSELADAMVNVGPTAAAFGWSMEDVNTALAILSERGIKGAEAGTALKSMMTNMMRPTTAVTDQLQALGIELYDTEGHLKALPDVIGDLADALYGEVEVTRSVGGATAEQSKELKSYESQIKAAQKAIEEYNVGARGLNMTEEKRAEAIQQLNNKIALYQKKIDKLGITEAKSIKAKKKLTEEERNQAIQILAGTYGMKAMNTLLAEGVEGWEDMAFAIDEAATAQEVAAAITETFNGKMEAMDGVVDTLKIRIGSHFLPVFGDLVGAFTSFLEDNAQGIEDFFGGIADWIGEGVQSIKDMHLEILFKPFADFFDKLKEGDDTGALRSFARGIANIAQAVLGIDATKANDLAKGIAEFGKGVIEAWDTAKAKVIEWWNGTADARAKMGEWYTKFKDEILPKWKEKAAEVWDAFKAKVGEWWDGTADARGKIVEWYNNFKSKTLPEFLSKTAETWNVAKTKVIEWWDGTAEARAKIAEWYKQFTTETLPKWATAVEEASDRAKSAIEKTVVPAVEELISTLDVELAQSLKEAKEAWEAWIEVEEEWRDLYNTYIGPILDKLNPKLQLTDTIMGLLNTKGEGATGIWADVKEAFYNAISPVERVKDLFEKVHDALGKIKDSAQWVIDRINELKDALANLKLPDWLTPGSPTPFEIGLKGIAKALGTIPPLSGTFNLAGEKSMGGGQAVIIHNHFGKDSIRSDADILELSNQIAQDTRLRTGAVLA